ncbi:MAG: TVP38/TMEM64 family protein [Verrucomicrobiales bacterium]|nr:TVP38/TMEM64 family protein [Verrucomicrobiales bacterium]
MRLLLLKAVVLVVLALVGALLARHPGVREWLAPAGRMSRTLREFGWIGIPIFMLVAGLLIAVGVPRLLFCPLAGAAFGFWGGFAASTVATMAAYHLSFLFIRGRIEDRETPYPVPESLAFLKYDPGLGGVILTRLLPVPGLIGTAALSLSPVRKRIFLLGSFIGLVPEAVPLLLLGAGLFENNPRHLAWMGAGALLLVVATLLLIRRLLRRYRGMSR